MKTGKDLKPGTVLRIDNDPWLVEKTGFVETNDTRAILCISPSLGGVKSLGNSAFFP